MPQPHTPPRIQGTPLHPSAAIAQEYAAAIMTLMRKLHEDAKRDLRRVFEESAFHAAAMDDDKDDDKDDSGSGQGNVAPQARMAINALLDRYTPLFGRLARKAVKRMIWRTAKNSAVTLGMSLREISKDFTIDPALTPRFQEIVTASTTEAASLIKAIPQQYLADVQGLAARSVTGGGGYGELVGFLDEKYGQNIRRARNTAMDQTRKAYANMTAARMRDAGMRQFIWLHTGGTVHPRPLHQEMSGNTYSLDDPPCIGNMYGKPVYGLPGQLINCRCVMRPVLTFGQEEKNDR